MKTLIVTFVFEKPRLKKEVQIYQIYRKYLNTEMSEILTIDRNGRNLSSNMLMVIKASWLEAGEIVQQVIHLLFMCLT